MDDLDIVDILNDFAQYQRAFSLEELSDLADPAIDWSKLYAALVTDSRFLKLTCVNHRDELFLPIEALYVYFYNLSYRFAQAKVSRVDESRLLTLMSSLRLTGGWCSCPTEIIQFGGKFGFIHPALACGQYVLPIAHILSFAWHSLAKAAIQEFSEICTANQNPELLEKQFQELVLIGLSNFNPKWIRIVLAREKLVTDKKVTLEELGKREGITRQRVQQMEAKFRAYTSDPNGKFSYKQREPRIRPFTVALLCGIAAKGGSLLIDKASPNGAIRRFVAKCAGVPLADIPICGLTVIGTSAEQIGDLNQLAGRNRINAEEMAANVERKQLCLSKADLMSLCDRLAATPTVGLTKVQRARIVLEMIGRPAHYSEISELYNDLFPDDMSTEHSIHAVLLRGEPEIVWVGKRGTYALHEWGYDRPTATIFETVAEIVRLKSAETGRPVPLSVILAEIGKYRRVVHPTSIYLASYLNPVLENIHSDCFVIRNPGED